MMGVGMLWFWLVFRHMPPVHDLGELLRNLPDAMGGAGHDIVAWFQGIFDKER